jgi:hypothetical protein
MSLWNDFLDNIAKPVGKTIAGSVDYWKDAFTGNLGSPSQFISNVATDAGVEIGATPLLRQLGVEEQAQQVIKDNLKYSVKSQSTSNDIVLKAGVKLHDEVISPYITRPVSTIGLLTDQNSPLYASDEFEKGFQVKDIVTAYNRSEKVSMGQAFTKSDLTPLKYLADVTFNAGGIDLDEVDLWNDNDIQRAFVDNTVGKYFTGVLDFTASNIAISGAFGAMAKVGNLGARKVGLTTKNKAASQFEMDINDGLTFKNSEGASGRLTTAGSDVQRLASTTDINEVGQLVQKYSNNANLIGPISRATDPNTIKDLLLADKGYYPALDRLSKNAPADLYEIADMNSVFKARAIEEGKLPEFDDVSWERLNAAFDDAINRVPEYRYIRDSLLDPQTKTPLMQGKDYIPAEPVIGKAAYVAGRERLGKLRAAAVTRDFSKLGSIEERILGGSLNGPITRIVRFTGTEKPLGFVTFSGSRPFDAFKEIDAFFDDIDLFKNGSNMVSISPTVKITAAEFRNSVKQKLANAETNIQRKNVLEELDDQIGLVTAFSNGFYDVAKIKNFTQEIKNKVINSTNSIARTGYAMDATGSRIITDAQTQSQLIESYRMAPWNFIEKELLIALKKPGLEVGVIRTTDAINAFYETFNKYWTLDVLAKPSYIPKNSLFEPALSATLAHGIDVVVQGVPSMTKNFLANNKNRVMGKVSKVYRGKEYRAVNKAVDDLTNQLDAAVAQLDALTAEASLFLQPEINTIKLSPKVIQENKAIVLDQLKKTQKLVDNIELELRDAISPFGTMSQVPTIAGLERRIAFIENETSAASKAKFGSDIANAKSAIGAAKGAINTLAPNAAEILAANKNIAMQYKAIDDILQSLGEARVKQADVFGKDAKYKARYYGKPEQYRMIAGQWIPIKSLFDENLMGAAFKSEFGNSRTVAATYLGERTIGVRQGMVLRRGPSTTTYINDPNYFEELAYYVNRSLRNDPLIKQALEGLPEEKIIQWAQSDAGTSYLSQFGIVTEGNIPNLVRDRIGLVNRYLPDAEARSLALTKDVTSVELQKILSPKSRDLSPIHPLDFNVHTASEFGARTLGQIEQTINKGASWIFNKLTAPENPIRWASADRFFADSLAQKVNTLAEQGFKFTKADGTVDIDKINSIRSAARREALDMNEKTFYTIRRQNRGLYAARLATAFPTASLNAFYRYGRFALKNPERVSQFLYNYQAAFRSFGVDEYGIPTDDPLKATHLVVPTTDTMGFFGGKGIRLNARSIGFLLNYPTPSLYASIATAKVFQWKPDSEDLMKQYLGSYYDVIFPYGPQTSLGMAVAPRWANDLWNYANGPEGKKDFLDSYKDVHNYYRTLDEMKILKYPGDNVIRKATQENFLVKFGWSFGSLFGVPAKADTRPMKLYEDAYGLLVNKYKSQGNDITMAKELAGAEFLSKVGTDFPLDRITFKGSASNAYIQPTTKAFNRVFVDNQDLIKRLISKDAELVGLITADLDENPKDFNLSVYRKLQDPDTKLPDGKLLNDINISPKEEEKRRNVNRVWSLYNQLTDALELKAQGIDKKSLRSHPELLAARKEVANTLFKKESEDWWLEYNDPNRGDKSFRYGRALNLITSDKTFMDKYGKTKFWSDVSDYMAIRNAIVSAYQALPSNDPGKSKMKKAYNATLDMFTPTWHPKLQDIIKRYFEEDTMKDTTPGGSK